MRERYSVLRWSVVLVVLVATGLLLRNNVGAEVGAAISLDPSNEASYILGERVELPGFLDFGSIVPSEVSVELVVQGPQPTVLPLPVAPGSHSFPAENLEVTVSAVQSTLPAAQNGIDPTRIDYDIRWTPPVLLDPAPPTA